MQQAGGEADAGAVGAEHGGEKIVGDWENSGVDAILGHEEPAGEALLNSVQAIARGGLRHLQAENDGVQLKLAVQLRQGREKFLQNGSRHALTVSGDLRDFLKRTAAQTGQGRDTDDAFVTDNSCLDGLTVSKDDDQRDQAIVEEVHELKRLVRLVKNIVVSQLKELQVRANRTEFVVGNSQEDLVLYGLPRRAGTFMQEWKRLVRHAGPA